MVGGLFTLPHLALGVGLTYVALCYLVNTTVAEDLLALVWDLFSAPGRSGGESQS